MLLFWFFSPPWEILAAILVAVLLLEVFMALFVSAGVLTQVSEDGIRQRILWHETSVRWDEREIKIGRGILFRVLRIT